MFCPKCATQNVEGAKFCRSCGANISLIPHALSGQLPIAPANEAIERAFRRKRRKEPSLAEGSRLLMMGIAFVVVSILIGKYSPGGWSWWYWMLIPAATFLGRGISDLIRARQAGAFGAAQRSPQVQAPNPIQIPSPRSTSELMPPAPSVTEGTTRHLNAEPPPRHFDSVENQKPS
ncbi:MAG: hypothetical protein DMF72_05290 [Acidobacteria bacterium]|nr:MAG: hypothetical protein DMF72_05290 [Acidobacteriota bacterium]